MADKFFTKIPTDRSLEAYKEWINRVYSNITGGKTDDSMTEEQWIENHKAFWTKVDEETRLRKACFDFLDLMIKPNSRATFPDNEVDGMAFLMGTTVGIEPDEALEFVLEYLEQYKTGTE